MSVISILPVATFQRRTFSGPTEARCFDAEHGTHALLVDGSRVYDVPADFESRLNDAAQRGPVAVHPPGQLHGAVHHAVSHDARPAIAQVHRDLAGVRR